MPGDRDQEAEDEPRPRELEDTSRPSTSLDHWETQSIDVHKTAFPVYEDDDDRGLSRTFRISIITGSILIMIAVILCIAVFLPHSSKEHGKKLMESDAKVVRKGISLACRATRFPQVCESSLSSNPSALRAVRSLDIVEAAIQVASQGEQQSHSQALILLKIQGNNANLTSAARHCEYLLRRADGWFTKCQSSALTSKIRDIQTWMSAALTYETDCRSSLGNVNTTTQYVGKMLQQMDYVITLTSNALSMVDAYGTYGADESRWKPPTRRRLLTTKRSLLEQDLHWLSSADRRLLEAPAAEIAPTVIVSKDGLGNYTSIQAAVDGAPDLASERYIIYIKAGVYSETVRVSYTKTSLTFVGDAAGGTIITGNRNVLMPGVTTFDSATVAVDGDGFIARNIAFENTAGPDMHQAVAMRVDSDLSAFENCSFLGYQDTLYVHSLRQFFRNCRIEGTIDFIFGNSASVFQDCQMLVRQGRVEAAMSTVTAQGRTDPAQTTALVFQNCIVNGTQAYMESFSSDADKNKAYLGRPWRPYSRTIFVECYLERLIRPEGWVPWNGTFALDTLFFGEYKNFGPGAARASARVPWSSQISLSEAMIFSLVSFLQGDQWLPATNVPFDLLF